MRSDRELLQLLLDNKEYFEYGLCIQSASLYSIDKISKEEHLRIRYYLSTNVNTTRKRRCAGYYWPRGKWKPREKWLISEINKLDGKRSFFTTLKEWFSRSRNSITVLPVFCR